MEMGLMFTKKTCGGQEEQDNNLNFKNYKNEKSKNI